MAPRAGQPEPRIGHGVVTLAWKKRTHLEWRVDATDTSADDYYAWRAPVGGGGAILGFDFGGTVAELPVEFNDFGRGWFDGGHVGDPAAALGGVVAHWINLPMISPSGGVRDDDRERTARWETEVHGWHVVIDAVPNHHEVFRQAAADESFAITHVMRFSRSDRAAFTGQQAETVLTVMQYAFSFAVGYWTCPAAPVGVDADETPRWSEWRPLHLGRPQRGAGWWNDSRGDDLAMLLEAFLAHWSDDTLRDPLRFPVTSAILAVETGFVEQRLITAVAALELLSWVSEVVEDRLGEREWFNLGGAKRLERLLRTADIDPSLTAEPEVADIARYAKQHGYHNCAKTISEIRNRVTHPKSTQDIYAIPGMVGAASRLATWWLELMILKRIGYVGHAANRTKLGRWVGESEPVPWASRSSKDRTT